MDFSHTARKNLHPPTQGDDSGYRLEFSQGGSPVDITGWTITFTAKRSHGGPIAIQQQATIENGPGGIATIELAASDTADLAGLYYYDIQVEYDDGQGNTLTRTIMSGRVPFEEDITD